MSKAQINKRMKWLLVAAAVVVFGGVGTYLLMPSGAAPGITKDGCLQAGGTVGQGVCELKVDGGWTYIPIIPG